MTQGGRGGGRGGEEKDVWKEEKRGTHEAMKSAPCSFCDSQRCLRTATAEASRSSAEILPAQYDSTDFLISRLGPGKRQGKEGRSELRIESRATTGASAEAPRRWVMAAYIPMRGKPRTAEETMMRERERRGRRRGWVEGGLGEGEREKQGVGEREEREKMEGREEGSDS